MKPRRVIVTLELETDAPLRWFKNRVDWLNALCTFWTLQEMDVHQVQVNVIKPEAKVRGRIVPVDQGDRVVRG